MVLTGKCREDFSYKYNMSNFNEYSEVLQNALIIEFFDSVGIYVSTYICHDNTFDFSINNVTYNSFTKTRQEATEQAIKQADEIYNNDSINKKRLFH